MNQTETINLTDPHPLRPTILVIDDSCGLNLRERQAFCELLALRDVTPVVGNVTALREADGERTRASTQVLANAVFISGVTQGSDGTLTNDLEGVRSFIRRGWSSTHRIWSMILLDYNFRPVENDPREFGAVILDALIEDFPFRKQFAQERQTGLCDIPVVMFSSATNPEDVERETDRRGSQAFFPRPLLPYIAIKDHLHPRIALSKLLFNHALVQDGQLCKVTDQQQAVNPYPHRDPPRLVGDSLAHLRLLQAARLSVENPQKKGSVLLLGDKGVGKGEIAKYIHDHSDHGSDQPVQVFLSGIPDTLVESELFGHVGRSFTDAVDRASPFKKAGEGTVFVDEIGNLPVATLNKLLLCVGDRKYTPVGSEDRKQLDIQSTLIFATNKNIGNLMNAGLFPSDLFDRMDDVIYVPSLNDRKHDIIPLFKRFLEVERSAYFVPDSRPINAVWTPELDAWLLARHWAGNIRELKSLARRIIRRRRYSLRFQVFDLDAESVAPGFGLSNFHRDINSLRDAMTQFRVSPELQIDDLEGIVPKLNAAAASIVIQLLDAAVNFFSPHDGSVNVVRLAEFILGKPTTGNKSENAKRQIKSEIFERFGLKDHDLPKALLDLRDRLYPAKVSKSDSAGLTITKPLEDDATP